MLIIGKNINLGVSKIFKSYLKYINIKFDGLKDVNFYDL